MTDSSSPVDPRKAKVEACQRHAADLLKAAEAVRAENLPHVAYHLAALGLEEMGKATLLTADFAVPGREDSPLRRADDHVHKLFWSVWGMAMLRDSLTPESFEEMKGFAARIHERRLRGLYVSVDLNDNVLPQDAVSAAQCDSLVELLRSTLKLFKAHEFKELDPEERDDLQWLMDIREEPQKAAAVFNSASIERLRTSERPREWLRSVRAEVAKTDAEMKALAERELAREPVEDRTLKWKIRFRVYTNSHSLRPKELSEFNDGMQVIKLTVGNRKQGELIVDLFRPKSLHVRRLWDEGFGLARSFVAALNIASRGFFWWSVPVHVSRYYELITDLEANHDCVVERQPILRISWGNQVLSKSHLSNAAGCLAGMVRIANEEHPSLENYIGGLTLLSKNDIHLQVEQNAFDTFYRSLKEAMREFGDWDGSGDYGVLFQKRMALHFSSEDQRLKYQSLGASAEARLAGRGQSTPITLTDVAVMKLAADAYLHDALFKLAHATQDASSSEPTEVG